MLTGLVEYGCKLEEKVKAMKSKIKENAQGTNSDRKETRTQTNDFDWKEEINIQLEQNEGTRIQKNEERLKNLWENFKFSNVWILVVPEEEQEQEIENLFEQIMKENFPNLAKEIDFQEAQRVPKKLDPKKNTPRHITIKLSKIKRQRENPKSNKGKGDSYLQRSSHKAIADFSKETLQERRGWNEVFEVMKDKTYIPDYSIQQSFHLEWKGK